MAEIAASLRELAYRLEDLDDGAALPPLYVHVGVQVASSVVPSEAARMALVDRIAGALGQDAALSAAGQYGTPDPVLCVYTSAPVAAAAAVVAEASA